MVKFSPVLFKQVKNPFEASQVVGITNYVDFGFELKTRFGLFVSLSGGKSTAKTEFHCYPRFEGQKSTAIVDPSTFQVAASWQANKNIMLKVVGPCGWQTLFFMIDLTLKLVDIIPSC